MLGLSILFDFIWLLRADWNKLIGLLVIINMMVKVVHIFLCHVVRLMVVLTFTFYLLWTTGPYLLCGATALRFRGDRFGGLGESGEGGSLPSVAGSTGMTFSHQNPRIRMLSFLRRAFIFPASSLVYARGLLGWKAWLSEH